MEALKQLHRIRSQMEFYKRKKWASKLSSSQIHYRFTKANKEVMEKSCERIIYRHLFNPNSLSDTCEKLKSDTKCSFIKLSNTLNLKPLNIYNAFSQGFMKTRRLRHAGKPVKSLQWFDAMWDSGYAINFAEVPRKLLTRKEPKQVSLHLHTITT